LNLGERIRADLGVALKAKNLVSANTLRMLISAVRNAEIEKHSPLTDDEILGQVQKGIRLRREAIEGFAKGGRSEMMEKEKSEIAVLEVYLPAQLSDAELDALVAAAISETGATGPADMGKVMKAVMAKSAGRTEGAKVSECVRRKLKPSALGLRQRLTYCYPVPPYRPPNFAFLLPATDSSGSPGTYRDDSRP